MSKHAICRCYYTCNIYLTELNQHVTYLDAKQFLRQYDQSKGFRTITERQHVIKQIEKEVSRRRDLGSAFIERRRIIQETYVPLHPDIYTLKASYFFQDFLKLVEYCQGEDATFEEAMSFLEETNISRVYAFPVFTAEFCQLFLEELAHFEDSDCPKSRPNTMNNYGINLNELGFDDFISSLRRDYIQCIAQTLYPDWGGGTLDSHKAFTVKYQEGEDLDLSYHYDNAEVTLNVALSPDDSFTGGNLYFGDMRTVPVSRHTDYKHRATFGLLHRGQHMHGARPIHTGVRHNLIIWMRSSTVRNKLCPMCNHKPDVKETVGMGDGFTLETQTVNVCSMA